MLHIRALRTLLHTNLRNKPTNARRCASVALLRNYLN